MPATGTQLSGPSIAPCPVPCSCRCMLSSCVLCCSCAFGRGVKNVFFRIFSGVEYGPKYAIFFGRGRGVFRVFRSVFSVFPYSRVLRSWQCGPCARPPPPAATARRGGLPPPPALLPSSYASKLTCGPGQSATQPRSTRAQRQRHSTPALEPNRAPRALGQWRRARRISWC